MTAMDGGNIPKKTWNVVKTFLKDMKCCYNIPEQTACVALTRMTAMDEGNIPEIIFDPGYKM